MYNEVKIREIYSKVVEAVLEQIQELRLVLLDRSLHQYRFYSSRCSTVQYSTVQYSTVQYRFYSSSLLIIYEGQPGPGHKETGYEEDSMDCEQFEDARAVAGDTKVAGQVEIFTGYHPVAIIYSWQELVAP